jgi:hypothetical protein
MELAEYRDCLSEVPKSEQVRRVNLTRLIQCLHNLKQSLYDNTERLEHTADCYNSSKT